MWTNKAISQIHLDPVSLFIFLLSKIPLKFTDTKKIFNPYLSNY